MRSVQEFDIQPPDLGWWRSSHFFDTSDRACSPTDSKVSGRTTTSRITRGCQARRELFIKRQDNKDIGVGVNLQATSTTFARAQKTRQTRCIARRSRVLHRAHRSFRHCSPAHLPPQVTTLGGNSCGQPTILTGTQRNFSFSWASQD